MVIEPGNIERVIESPAARHTPAMRGRAFVPSLVLGLAGCDLLPGGEPAGPTWDPLALPDKPDDPRDCAGPGTPHDLEGEAIDEAYLRAEDPDAACSGSWQVDDYTPAAWTIEIAGHLTTWTQLAAHPQGGAVVALDGRLTRYDAQGEVLWTRFVDVDIDRYALRIDAQGHVYTAARLDTYLDVLVFDADGEPLATLPTGTFGRTGVSQLDLWEGDVMLGGYDETLGAVLMRMTPSGEQVLVHPLEQGVLEPFVELDGQGVVYYGDGPARLLDSEGKLIVELNTGVVPDASFMDAHRAVAGRESGGFLIAQRGESGVAARAIDGSGATAWFRERTRGEFYSFAQAIASNPLGGGVVVGYETFDNRLDGYDAFITFAQPLVLGFDAAGEVAWADRVAVGGMATNVSVGPGGEVYVVGTAEFRGNEGYRDLEQRTWLRRYH